MSFRLGQSVIYNRPRSGRRAAKDYEATYVRQCEPWGNGMVPHQVLVTIDGKVINRFVALTSLREPDLPPIPPPELPAQIEDLFDRIDAGFFTGDVFHNEERLQRVEWYMGRWRREAQSIRDALASPE